MHPSDDLLVKFEANQYLRMTSEAAIKHYGTQGDGNHFFFVGRVASSGELAIVTHHGSRKPGALLYKAGMAKAESYRKKLAPEVPKHNAWIPADTQDGEDYWWALQLIREWTKGNHRAIHGAVADYLKLRVRDRFWNEHNFVFQKSDGLFYHAKGATPAYPYFSNDTDGRTLIPLNMAQPVLITEGLNADNGLGFAPHGAGRNYSRTQFMKTVGDRNQFIKV
jgi:RNA-splicing ligase RtcB